MRGATAGIVNENTKVKVMELLMKDATQCAEKIDELVDIVHGRLGGEVGGEVIVHFMNHQVQSCNLENDNGIGFTEDLTAAFEQAGELLFLLVPCYLFRFMLSLSI